MAITDWPADERPREKLMQKGVEALSDAELLAIFLRVGVVGNSAVDLARGLLTHFGSLKVFLVRVPRKSRDYMAWGSPSIASFKLFLR